jgi:hypothetical protein
LKLKSFESCLTTRLYDSVFICKLRAISLIDHTNCYFKYILTNTIKNKFHFKSPPDLGLPKKTRTLQIGQALKKADNPELQEFLQINLQMQSNESPLYKVSNYLK